MSTRNDVKAYSEMLQAIRNPQPTGQLNESVEDEQLFVVTEGWDDGDMRSLVESEDYDFLSESIFGGAPKHIIDSVVKAGVKRGGEDSSVNVTSAKQKGHVYDHLKNTHEGDKNEANHTIVRHNGKVIASIHPQGEKGNVKFDTHNHEAKEPETKTKTAAYQHVYDAVEKAGGYKGHNVEIHSIRADLKRDGKNAERAKGGHTNSENQSKSFKSIAARAASKLADKHGSAEAVGKRQDTKIKGATTRLNTEVGKASKSNDYKKVSARADTVNKLKDGHPSADPKGFAIKHDAKKGKLVRAAAQGGEHKDNNVSSDVASKSKMASRIAARVKSLKEGTKPYVHPALQWADTNIRARANADKADAENNQKNARPLPEIKPKTAEEKAKADATEKARRNALGWNNGNKGHTND
jgi:hypothetical protein